jgi:hypothetical protein
MTKRYETDKTYAALVDALWYNVGIDAIKTIVDKFNEFNQDESSHYFSTEDIDKDWYYDKELNTYWTMFVLMYGDYGTSPRSGWIKKTKESMKFFEGLYNDLKEIDD